MENGWGPSETLGERIFGKKSWYYRDGKNRLAVAKRLNVLGAEIHYHNRNRLNKNVEKNIMQNIGKI